MLNDLSLNGDKIVLTGTHVTATVKKQIEQLGGQAIHLPLITVNEIKSDMDRQRLEKVSSMIGLFSQVKMRSLLL